MLATFICKEINLGDSCSALGDNSSRDDLDVPTATHHKTFEHLHSLARPTCLENRLDCIQRAEDTCAWELSELRIKRIDFVPRYALHVAEVNVMQLHTVATHVLQDLAAVPTSSTVASTTRCINLNLEAAILERVTVCLL